MPYIVITETTPLWKDHKMMEKKGIINKGTEFKSDEYFAGTDMLHTESVMHVPKKAPAGTVVIAGAEYEGYGWIERKNCESFNPQNPPDVPPSPYGGLSIGTYLVTIKKVD